MKLIRAHLRGLSILIVLATLFIGIAYAAGSVVVSNYSTPTYFGAGFLAEVNRWSVYGFTIPANVVGIESVRTETYDDVGPFTFNLVMYGDNGGVPDTASEQILATRNNVGPFTLLDFNFNPPIAVTPGERIYIGVKSTTTDGDVDGAGAMPTGSVLDIRRYFTSNSGASWSEYTGFAEHPLIEVVFVTDSGTATTSSIAPRLTFSDGRLNRFDAAAPIVVYPVTIGDAVGMNIYQVTAEGKGAFLFQVTPDDIAAVPESPESNTLIEALAGVQVWRLTSGEYQINAPQYNGKTYVLIFDEIISSIDYNSFEEN